MNNKILVTLIVIIAVVTIGAYYYPSTTKIVEREVDRPIGAVSTLDGVDNAFVSIGGYKQYYYHQPMAATSSVVCAIKNPFAATSTLKGYKFQVTNNGIAVAQTLDVSTSTSAYASSTPSYIRAFAGGTGRFSAVWGGFTGTTTSTLLGLSPAKGGVDVSNVGYSDNIIGPSEFITLRIATSSAGTFGSYYTGTCSGIIERL